MTRSFNNLLISLRAVAEPTRLRVLAMLAHGELTVGEITRILGQSQPRVSRHLKLLCDGGLLERFKEQHSVYYRLAADPTGFGEELLARLATDDVQLNRDRARHAETIAERMRRATDRLAEQTLDADATGALAGTAGAVLQAELKAEPVGDLLDVGTGAGQILRVLGPNAKHAIGLDTSVDALRLARSHVHGAGLKHCVFRRGDMYRLPYAANSFDTVTIGRVLAHATHPQSVIAEAVRVLRPQGRLVLIEDFDALDASGARNPLAVLRQWLAEAGFHCERLRPVDTETTHLLVAIGRRPVALKEAA